ncbi:MAG: sigma-54 dependent transcriptional regulator [Pseudomonadota bacterium]
MANLILIVDDEPVQRRLMEATLEKLGYKTATAESGEAALAALDGKTGKRISAVILDLVMPEMDGMAVLEIMKSRKYTQPVIVQTAQGGVETAVNAMRAGAVDFVIKPAAPQRLKVSLQNALKMGALEGEIKRISKSAAGQLTMEEIISASPNMDRVKAMAQKAAQSSIPVLIEGESGVGKELIARAVQGMSSRASKNFVTVNCGALPENLGESILFGHEKGAFTGANEKHHGKFQEANGGTLFLDEVGELTLDMQVKLLRAIQEGEIDPVGASKPVKVDFRLISATNRNLLEEVKDGNFREDLYYRLNVLPLTVPPLRDRREDIPELLRHFIARISTEEGRSNISGIDGSAMDMLCEYDWPGNIRQLENAVFRAVVLCEGDQLTIDEFPQIAIERNVEVSKPTTQVQETTMNVVDPAPALDTPVNIVPPAHDGMTLVNENDDIIMLEEAEKKIIQFAIEKYDGRMSTIARKLGIGRSTLYRKLREYGLEEASQ